MQYIRECQRCHIKFEVMNLTAWAKRKYCNNCKRIRNNESSKKYKSDYRKKLKDSKLKVK
jgi:hypothetical protein